MITKEEMLSRLQYLEREMKRSRKELASFIADLARHLNNYHQCLCLQEAESYEEENYDDWDDEPVQNKKPKAQYVVMGALKYGAKGEDLFLRQNQVKTKGYRGWFAESTDFDEDMDIAKFHTKREAQEALNTLDIKDWPSKTHKKPQVFPEDDACY